MAPGFDTTEDCTAYATTIAATYRFVGRYLSKSHWKVITSGEAMALKGAGLGIVLVYEDAPTTVSYFSTDRGTSDATRAALQAAALGIGTAGTIYFAVDYDASAADIAGPITDYFKGVKAAILADGKGFAIGVYGSGTVCGDITGAGLASMGWLACAGSWGGPGAYAAYKPSASIVQGLPTHDLGLSIDPDDAPTGIYGAF